MQDSKINEASGPDSHLPFEQVLQQRQQGPQPALFARKRKLDRVTSNPDEEADIAKKIFKRESKNRFALCAWLAVPSSSHATLHIDTSCHCFGTVLA